MKTVSSTLTLLVATLALGAVGSPALAGPEVPKAKLLDMYALKEGDSYIVHIIADGDISEFLSDRKAGEGTYKLTLDVPALSPLESKYHIETPFSRQFQVWPMQLGNKIYSRVEIELDTQASSVVGVENTAHVFVRIQREGTVVVPSPSSNAPSPAATTTPMRKPSPETTSESDESPVAITALGVVPVEPPTTEDSDAMPAPVERPEPINDPMDGAMEEPFDTSDNAAVNTELFFNLFPTPAGEQQTLFNVSPIEDIVPNDSVVGIRVGRFALQPSIDASYVRGSNLLLLSEDAFDDRALLVRGRLAMVLLDSVNELSFAYEGRYRDFETFELDDRFTNVFDVNAKILTTPSSSIALGNHFLHGAFEAREFDPGGEVVTNTDPFYRNETQGTFALELSERLGGELSGSFNRVEFSQADTDFFNYDETALGAALLYNLTPLTSLVGEYTSLRTRPDTSRPEAFSNGNVVMFGVRGELTALLQGQVRAGYARQTFGQSVVPQGFSGFVADVRLTRRFGEETALDVGVGRKTNPSAYEDNGFYLSNYGTVQFVMPLTEKLRLSSNAVIFGNNYPLPDITTGLERHDKAWSGAIGVSYFWTPLSFLSVDYRHDRRDSNLEQFSYRNNAVQFMVGFGFLTR